jgi:hypothetical protein
MRLRARAPGFGGRPGPDDVRQSAERLPLISGGKVRALAVTGARAVGIAGRSHRRIRPARLRRRDLVGDLAPAGLPADVAAKLTDSLQKIAKGPRLRAAHGRTAVGHCFRRPDDLRTTIQSEAEKTGKLIRDLGITAPMTGE